LSTRIDGDWLRRWHDRHAGATSRAFGGLRDADGRTSYARLADYVGDGDRVLDLACGDGRLLVEVLIHGPGSATGIDFSAGELAAARARDLDVELVEGRVQALPFDDDAFDRVVCHLALMLFADLEHVLREVRRVLAPGGTFGIVVSRPEVEPASEAMKVWRDELRDLSFADVRLVDVRVLRGDLPKLLGDAGFREVDVRPFDLRGRLSVDDAWMWFAESYGPDRMNPADFRALERRWKHRMRIAGEPVRLVRLMQEIVAS